MIVAVVNIIAVVMHFFALEAFQPGTPLFEIASTGTQNVNGAERAQLWWEIGGIWVPLIAVVAIWVWALFREYRRQTVTRARRPA